MKKIECQLKSGFMIPNDNLYQDDRVRHKNIKITLGNNCEGIETGEISSCLGNKSLGNDWGGVRKTTALVSY